MDVKKELDFLEALENVELANWPTWFMLFKENEGFFFDPKAEQEAVKLFDFKEENSIKYFKKSDVLKVFKTVLIG
jgi:hypothetical protein